MLIWGYILSCYKYLIFCQFHMLIVRLLQASIFPATHRYLKGDFPKKN